MQSLVFSCRSVSTSKAARAGLEAANLSLKDAREQVALDASTAYIELDTVNSELEAARQQEQNLRQIWSIEQQRAEAGVDSDHDLLQARLKAAQLKLRRAHLETRAATLAKQLAVLTGLPVGSITADHASIPEIPAVTADEAPRRLPGLIGQALARSKQLKAHGDDLAWRRPQIGFGAVYNYDSNELNSYSTYYNNFTPNNVSFGLSDFVSFLRLRPSRQGKVPRPRRCAPRSRPSRHSTRTIADCDPHRQPARARCPGRDCQPEAADRRRAVEERHGAAGTGQRRGNGPERRRRLSPKAEQQARIDERQKYEDALDAGLDLSKARLNLLRALGHMEDWLNELHAK